VVVANVITMLKPLLGEAIRLKWNPMHHSPSLIFKNPPFYWVISRFLGVTSRITQKK
jgi:hypothetical protein